MKQAVIDNLPDSLKKKCCTLKKASKDETNDSFMTESQIKVINFDKVPNEFSRGKGWHGVPKSNDALYISENDKWIFIEFKNGRIDIADIYRKIYDSILMSIQMKFIKDYEFVRNNVHYILVYNSAKYGKNEKSESLSKINDYTLRRAKTEKKLFDVKNFEGYLLKETHTYSAEEFEEKFVKIIEDEERQEKENCIS